MDWIEPMVTEHLERVSVALADVMVSPSGYLVDYTRERGWKIPSAHTCSKTCCPATPVRLPADQ